jgi:hypothetical protein
VVADCFYGDNPGCTDALGVAKVPLVLASTPQGGLGARRPSPPVQAAHDLGWRSRTSPGQWRRITRRFRAGHTEAWWAADATLGGFGPDQRLRLVVATTDPTSLPGTAAGSC